MHSPRHTAEDASERRTTGVADDMTLLTAAIVCCVLIAAVWLGISLYFGTGGHPTPGQFDSLLYMQYGKAIAEGHPYQFTPNALPSTGSTSHLYPALLAVLYLGGAHGDAFASACFALSAVCFVAFVFLYWLVAKRLMPRAAPLALFLTVLSGQTMYSILGQTDITVFMVLAAGAVAAALYGRYRWLAVLLVLSSLCRPEGLVLSIAWVVCVLVFGTRNGEKKRCPLGAGFAGIGGYVLVLALNIGFTGRSQFHSLAGKGYVHSFPLIGAGAKAVSDFVELLREVFFTLGDGGRGMYGLVIVCGLLGLVGILARRWDIRSVGRRVDAWILFSGLAVVGLIALSGWQGVANDRYLGWFLPLWYLYVAFGARVIGDRLNVRHAFAILSGILLVFQVLGLCALGAERASVCRRLHHHIQFTKAMHAWLPVETRIGVVGGAGLAYYMPGREVVNVAGIETPQLTRMHPMTTNLEILKYEPVLRNDVWLMMAANLERPMIKAMIGEELRQDTSILNSPDNLVLYKAAWGKLEKAKKPVSEKVAAELAGFQLRQQLDIGYANHERGTNYKTFLRTKGIRIMPFVATGPIGDVALADVGRAVIGAESFTIPVRPGRSVRAVMRTGNSANVPIFAVGGEKYRQDLVLGDTLSLRVVVNDQPFDIQNLALEQAENDAFAEIVFDIPAELVTTDTLRVTVGGDHISYGYWFYQRPEEEEGAAVF